MSDGELVVVVVEIGWEGTHHHVYRAMAVDFIGEVDCCARNVKERASCGDP